MIEEIRALLRRVKAGQRSWSNPDFKDPANDSEGERQLSLFEQAESYGWLRVISKRESMSGRGAVYIVTGTLTPEGEKALEDGDG